MGDGVMRSESTALNGTGPVEGNAGAVTTDPSISLRLLLIDDDENDERLIVRELQRSGYHVTWERVDTAASLENALRKEWDVVTCDWVMPAFTAPAALEILSQHEPAYPVIIVSGQAAEEVAVSAMKAGACDVVSKWNLVRLGPAIERELRDAAARRAGQRAEKALRLSELRYRRLFESAKDGIIIMNADSGRIIDANPFLLKLLDYGLEELVGQELWEIAPFRDIAANKEAFQKLQAEKYIRYDHLPLESKSGRRTEVEFVSNVYAVNGDRIIQCNIRDITARRRMELEIASLTEGLERRVQERTIEVDALNAELTTFSQSVSHDLRAPLRQIESFSELLMEDYADKLDGEGRDYLTRIAGNAARMGQLIADLLRLSQTTQGQMALESVDLSAIARSVIAELRRGEPNRRADVIVRPGLVVEGDPHLLAAVLENLLGNSWKYTSHHPSARIEFGMTERDGRRVFFARDDGAGFDMTKAGNIFGAFQRMHDKGEFEGTGIGLATVQRIVHRHGGLVWAEGAIERGATIYFTIGSPSTAIHAVAG
jgi:PAS domain S-box-containing protein